MARSAAREAPGEIVPFFMNLPAILDEHINVAGFYLAATIKDVNKRWRGFVFFDSNSETSGFVQRKTYSDQAITGTVVKLPLDSTVVDHRVIDHASSITVTLDAVDDELENVSENEMLAGKNRFLVGNEIIGATSCSLISTDFEGKKTYALTNLLRGLKDTAEHMDTHNEFERFIKLDGPGVYFIPHATSKINDTLYYKLVPDGHDIVSVAAYQFISTGDTLKPFRPISIVGTRNGSNDITLTWELQSRRTTQLFDQGKKSEEDVEAYRIYPLESITSDVALRMIDVSGAGVRTCTYTAAQQTTDGKTPGNPIDFELVQLSSVLVDVGNKSRVTIS